MAQNKVRYRQGLSMPEIFDRCGSPARWEVLVQAWRWPQGFAARFKTAVLVGRTAASSRLPEHSMAGSR